MSNSYKITGRDAIRLAERENLTIHCHSNPIDDGGVVTVEVATQILKEDPKLIYVTVTPSGWRDKNGNHCDGEGRTVESYFNWYRMTYLGPDEAGIEPCWSDAN